MRAARRAIGPATVLMVDANGAYDRRQASAKAVALAAACDASWFDEPVSSDNLAGLRLLRDTAIPGLEIAAGEYGYDAWYFRRMLEGEAVDVLQVDATRCGGITGFLRACAFADPFAIPVSAHTAPTVHAHAWLSGVINRRVPLPRWSQAIDKRPDDMKTVLIIAE